MKTATAERPEKLAELIARRIVHSIASQGFQPGHHLPAEAAMLEEYGVGRNSLREALRLLELHGLIRMKPGPGGGPVVAEVRSESFGKMLTLFLEMRRATFRELVDARAAVEPHLAALAAQNRSAAEAESLLATANLTGSVPVDDGLSWVAAARQFHDAVTEMSKNRVLDVIARGLKEIHAERAVERTLPTPAECRATHSMHGAIARAIAGQDASAAERLMRQDVTLALHRLEGADPEALHEVLDWR